MKLKLLFLMLLLLHSNISFSQWSTDPAKNTRISQWGFVSGAVPDGEGGAIIAYNKNFNYPPGIDLYIQRIDSSGYLKWNPDGILISAARYDQYYSSHPVDNLPCMLPDLEGGSYFAYIDYQRSALLDWLTDSCDVFVQHIDKDGNLLWGNIGIQLNPKGISGDMFALIPDGLGNIIAVWSDTRASDDFSTFGDYQKYAQKIDYWGNFLWQKDGICLENDSHHLNHVQDVASDGEGGIYYIKYSGLTHLDAQLNQTWQVPTIYSDRIFEDGFGGIFEISNYYDSLFVNRTNTNGERLWGDCEGLLVTTNANLVWGFSNLIADGNGGIILGWADSSYIFYSQHISNSGTLLWGNDGIQGWGTAIVGDGEGGAVMSNRWRYTNNHLTQHIHSSGQPQWGVEGVLFSSRENFDSIFSVPDGKGGVIFIWSEVSNPPNRGVLCQRVNRYGKLGGLATKVNKSLHIKPNDFVLHQNYPNPFNHQTIIHYSLLQRGEVQLIIFNTHGEEVITLVNKTQPEGNHSVIWNGKNTQGGDVSSGIYLCQLKVNEFFEKKKLTIIR